MAKISDLSADSKEVEIEAKVVEVLDPRTVNTRFGPKQVAIAVIEDDTGRINLNLWEDQIEKVKKAKTVKIEGGYVTVWKDAMQLNVGRQGKLETE